MIVIGQTACMNEQVGQPAVVQAYAAVQALEQMVLYQVAEGDPAHEDFYALGDAVAGVVEQVERLAVVLADQVAAYGTGRILREDTGGDAGERLVLAVEHLGELRGALAAAGGSARRYRAEVGHIGVEVDRVHGSGVG